MSEDYDREKHQTDVKAFFAAPDPGLAGEKSSVFDAAYALAELGLLPDSVDSISKEQMLLCWKVVEKLRTTPFPKELRM